jgi:protein-tyrosine-phosphatase
MTTDRPVLFVCLHGAAKSVLAAADFQRLAAQRGLHIPAASAGTEPDAAIAPGVLRTLLAEGVDLRGQAPRRLTRADVAAAARIVAFGCDLGETVPAGTTVEQWATSPRSATTCRRPAR